MWQVMMAKLAPPSPDGDYVRPPSEFRGTIAPSSMTEPGAGDRYRLIVGWGCPWAHRTLVARALLGLEGAIALWWVQPDRDTGRWVFASDLDPAQAANSAQAGESLLPTATNQRPDPDRPAAGTPLATLYQRAEPGYGGRATVPVLWDTHTDRVINNESAEIIEILNQIAQAWPGDRPAASAALDLNPPARREAIAIWNERIYTTVNNGVYRCGFAQSQAAYDRACGALFDTLDLIESTLGDGRNYLCGDVRGDRPTLVDVRLFPTLIRFDLVYYSLFNCNRRRIADYPHLSRYLRRMYQLPGIAQTCDLETVIEDYYGALFPLNPGGIVPAIADPQAFRTWLTQTP
jgi:putative glutathione S-transferase